MNESIKMSILAFIFTILSMGIVFLPYAPLKNICYFLLWIMALLYLVIGIILVIATIDNGPSFEKAAEDWEPFLFPKLMLSAGIISIVAIVSAGKFVLGIVCVMNLICVCVFVEAVNEYRKEHGLS